MAFLGRTRVEGLEEDDGMGGADIVGSGEW